MRRIALVLALAGALFAGSPAEAASISVRFTSLTSPVSRGSHATASVHTSAQAYCHITVTYKTGPSHAKGLGAKHASGSGSVSWTWTVGSNTTPGSWPVRVSCSKSGHTASKTKYFRVTR